MHFKSEGPKPLGPGVTGPSLYLQQLTPSPHCLPPASLPAPRTLQASMQLRTSSAYTALFSPIPGNLQHSVSLESPPRTLPTTYSNGGSACYSQDPASFLQSIYNTFKVYY